MTRRVLIRLVLVLPVLLVMAGFFVPLPFQWADGMSLWKNLSAGDCASSGYRYDRTYGCMHPQGCMEAGGRWYPSSRVCAHTICEMDNDCGKRLLCVQGESDGGARCELPCANSVCPEPLSCSEQPYLTLNGDPATVCIPEK